MCFTHAVENSGVNAREGTRGHYLGRVRAGGEVIVGRDIDSIFRGKAYPMMSQEDCCQVRQGCWEQGPVCVRKKGLPVCQLDLNWFLSSPFVALSAEGRGLAG